MNKISIPNPLKTFEIYQYTYWHKIPNNKHINNISVIYFLLYNLSNLSITSFENG